MSAQVFALPTSIAVRKLPCWFAIRYRFPNLFPKSLEVRQQFRAARNFLLTGLLLDLTGS
jgi:hypothetical protein